MKVSHKIALLLFFGILIPATVMTYINYSSSAKIITTILQNNLRNSVKQRINYVQYYSEHLMKSLTIISQKQELLHAFHEANETKLTQILEPHSRAHSFYDMFVIDTDGTIEFTLKKESDLHKNLYEKPLVGGKFSLGFMEVMKSHKATITNFSYYKPSQKYASFLLVPIYEKEKIVAVLAAQLDIDIFVQLSSDYSGLGESGEIIFAEKVGERVVFINKLRNDPEAIFKHYVPIGSKQGLPIQKAVAGEFGSGVYYDYENIEVIASWGYIPSFNIGMVVKIDTSEAYAQIEYLKNLVLFMGLIMLGVILYLIWYMKKIVENLEMKRVQYEYAINGTNDGLWDWDIVAGSIYFSPQLKHMLGYKNEELENSLEAWERLIHPEDLEYALAYINLCQRDPNQEYNIEYRARHKDGSWIWILDRGQTIFKKGKAIRMVGFHTDITARKELEEKLLRSKQDFEQFMEYIPAHIMILDDGKIIYANSEVKNYFESENLLGKSANELLPPDIVKTVKEFDHKVLEEGASETTIEVPNFKGKRTIFQSFSFIIGEKSQKRQGVVSLDITQNRLKELKIREVRTLLSNIINSIDNLIFVKDVHSVYLECNSAFAKFVGRSREEIVGKNDYDLFSKEVAEKRRLEDEKVLKEQQTKGSYEWVVYPDKKEVYLYTLKSKLYDENSQVIGIVGNAVDMTESYNDKKELEEKEELMLAQSRHAAMGEMISMIAHQWRQPISVISMDANNILVDIELDSLENDSLRSDVSDIIEQTKYLSKTIDDFRDFFKPSKVKDEVSIANVFADAFNVISKSLENNNIHVVNEFTATTKLTLFSHELLQVIINILKNAKEALLENREEGREIRNRIYEENEEVVISICDNAGGIKAETLGKVFEPYFTTKELKNGTGLGLYMSKTIVEKHLNGTIRVKSSVEGACFEIRLPKKSEDEK